MKPKHLTFCLITILLFLILPSNRPAPRPLESTKEEQKHSGTTEKTSPKKYNITNPTIPSSQTTIIIKSPFTQAPPTTKKPTQQSGENNKEESSTNWWLVLFTGILAFVAFLQLFTLFYQIRSTKRERRISERAWIMVGFNIQFTPGENAIRYNISNTGKTPAFIKDIIPPKFGISTNQIITIPKRKLPTNMVIFPNENIGRIEPILNPMTVSTQQEIYLWGAIIYDDVFRKRRYTRFYRVYDPNTKYFVIPSNIQTEQNDAN